MVQLQDVRNIYSEAEGEMADIILGMELNSKDIRLALVRTDKKIRVLDTSVIPAPEGCIADGEIVYAEGVTSVIKEYIDRVASSARKPTALAISLNSPNIITRKVNVPKKGSQETASAVSEEIFKVFSSIKDTHTIAHRATSITVSSERSGKGTDAERSGKGTDAERSGKGTDAETCVFVALCPNVMIKSYEALSEAVGIPLRYIDIKPNALSKAAINYLGLKKDAAGLMIDVGYKSSLINVIVNGEVVISRFTPTGVHAIDSYISESQGVPSEEAEKMRLSGDFSAIGVVDGNGAGGVAEGNGAGGRYGVEAVAGGNGVEGVADGNGIRDGFIAVGLSDVEDQVRQVMDFVAYDLPDEELSFLTVTGEGYYTPGVAEYLSNRFCMALTPLTLNHEVGAFADFIPAASAVGAVLRDERRGGDINFYAKANLTTLNKKKLFNRHTIALTFAVSIFAIAVLISAFFHVKNLSTLKSIEAIKTQEISNRQASQLEDEILAAKEKNLLLQALIDEINAGSLETTSIMASISAVTPEDLFISTMSVLNEDETVLVGKSKDYDGVSWLALKLRESGAFNSVQISSIVSNTTSAGDVIDYSFSITIFRLR